MYRNIFLSKKHFITTEKGLFLDLPKKSQRKWNRLNSNYIQVKQQRAFHLVDSKFLNFNNAKEQFLNFDKKLYHGISYQSNNLFTYLTTMKIQKCRLKSTKVELNSIIQNKTDVDDSNQIYIANKKAEATEIFYVDSPSMREVRKLFPTPKTIVHNFYQVFYGENNKTVSLTPTYKAVKSGNVSKWICTYHVFWPEEMKFLAKEHSKKDASNKAALACLDWLRNNKKLTDQGTPIIYDKEQVKKLTRKTTPSLILGSKTIDDIQKLIELYQTELEPYILAEKIKQDETIGDLEESTCNVNEVKMENYGKRRYLDESYYLAKEKVELPISKYKEEFINLLNTNQIIIIRGQPGCGKSTRIPQYVLETWAEEAGSLGKTGLIAVTQPRRIAAISLAERVAIERDEPVGKIIGYQVRLNSNFNAVTGRILYCTTGILLRHLQSDSNLSKFSHIILDEAHERDVNTDLLMNLVKGALKRNSDLKLIVMSATIDTDTFSKYYDNAVVMDIPGFTYPVKEHFLDDCKIDLSKTLKMCALESPTVVHEEVVKVLEFIHNNKPEGAILCFLPGWEDISKISKMIPTKGDVAVYCLHSRLQDSEQWKIFSKPPPGVRKIILATNIAETSVTIDDVVYVVDTGIQKDLRFDVVKGINCIDNHWISQANARQRKGRAGRVQAGESYHLYTKQKYNSFPEYSIPEIQTTSLNKIILDCKVFSNNMNALEFMRSLPTSPDENATIRAVNELIALELLDSNENLTPLGKTVADFQLEPKLSKAMINAVIFKCVTPIVDITTLFSAETEFFVSGLLDKEEVKQTKQAFCNSSDHLAMMRLFEKWLQYKDNNDIGGLRSFCNDVNIVGHKMNTVEKLRKIHFDYLYNGLSNVLSISDEMSDNNELVKAVLYSGVGNILQYRNWDIVKNRLKTNVNVFLTRSNHKATISLESVNFRRRKYPSNYLLYINETRSNIRRTTIVRECSLIPDISVLLFSNSKIIIENVKEERDDTISLENQVEVLLENTNIKFICERSQAEELIKLKDALASSYQYYIKQLTESGTRNDQLNTSWSKFLTILGDILAKYAV